MIPNITPPHGDNAVRSELSTKQVYLEHWLDAQQVPTLPQIPGSQPISLSTRYPYDRYPSLKYPLPCIPQMRHRQVEEVTEVMGAPDPHVDGDN